MCENCFISEYKKIEDDKTNSNIENKITVLVSKQKMQLINNITSKKIHENYSVYKCNSCSEIWCFSSADLYWRGFLLKQKNLSSFYERLLKKQNRIKRNGILLLILIIIVIYIILKI